MIGVLSEILVGMVSAGLYDESKEAIRYEIKNAFSKAKDEYGLILYDLITKMPSKEIQVDLGKYIANYLIEDVDFADKIKRIVDESQLRIERFIEAEKDPREQSYKFIILSDIYLFKENYADCLNVLEKALKIFRDLGDLDWEGQVLVKIGNLYNIQNEDSSAIKAYESALVNLNESAQKAYWRAAIFNNIGSILAKNEYYNEAEEKYLEALKVDEEYLKSEAILNLGNIYRRQKKFDKSIKMYETSISNISGGNSLSGLFIQKMALIGKANNYIEMEPPHYSEAIASYKNCFEVMEKLGYKKGMCIALLNIGTIFYKHNEFKDALDYYDKSFEHVVKANDQLLECAIMMNRGCALRRLEKYDESINIYEQALKIYGKVKIARDRFIEDESLNLRILSIEPQLLGNIGNAYLDQGNFDAAIKYYEQALTIVDAEADYRDEARLLMHLGVSYCNRKKEGDIEKALASWDNAKIILKNDTKSSDYMTIIEWKDKLTGRR